MLKAGRLRGIVGAIVVFALCSAVRLSATRSGTEASISNASVTLTVRAGAMVPQLASMLGPAGLRVNNIAAEDLPASVEVNGQTVRLQWKLVPQLGRAENRRLVFVYDSARPHLRLWWEWRARSDTGPMEHRIIVQNLDSEELWLPLIDSLRLEIPVTEEQNLRSLYVEKGADSPSPVGTHVDAVVDGFEWTGRSSTYAFPQKGQPREIIPAVFVFNSDREAGWFAGIEFSGRTRISLKRSANYVISVLGLDPEPGPFRTRIMAGETFETPAVFLGMFAGGSDGAANQLHGWVRKVLGNPITWRNPNYPLTVNNSWGGGMQIDEASALRMIDDAKQLGIEMFHIDAGWFRGVGDWYPDPKKFPRGLAFIADEAHKRAMRFGLWVDWTQAGLDAQPGALNARDEKIHDWLVTDLPPDWKPEEFKGQTVDVGDPAAHDYLAREVNRIVTDYHLDMLEHDGYLVAQGCVRDDHPHAQPNRSTMRIVHDWGSYFVIASNSTDVSYRAVRAYYDIQSGMRSKHPGLLLEICNDGGRIVDFGSAAHGDYFSMTDTYDPLSNRRAFYDTSYMLPPAMLESYVEKWPAPRAENFMYMLRSGMMGWLTIMMDTTTWTPQQHEAARKEIALYKQKLRPLIRDAQLFHVSERPDGVHWDGMQYWDPARGEGVLYAFRGSTEGEGSHSFALKGLESEVRYKLHFQNGTAPDRVLTGRELMSEGVQVHLAHPLSSELVFMGVVRNRGGRR